MNVFSPVGRVENGGMSLLQMQLRHSQSPDVIQFHFSARPRLRLNSPSLPTNLTPTRKRKGEGEKQGFNYLFKVGLLLHFLGRSNLPFLAYIAHFIIKVLVLILAKDTCFALTLRGSE